MTGRIIGITGKKGHGKNTVGDLVKLFLGKGPDDTVLLSYAQPLKNAVSILFCLPDKYMHDQKFKEVPLKQWDNKTSRELLQWLGTDVLRNQFSKDIFIQNMEQRIEKYQQLSQNIVITDVRFNNEAKLIHKLGGVVVHVDARNRLGRSNDDHETEKGIDSKLIDLTIYNNSDKENLEMEVFQLVNQLKNDAF